MVSLPAQRKSVRGLLVGKRRAPCSQWIGGAVTILPPFTGHVEITSFLHVPEWSSAVESTAAGLRIRMNRHVSAASRESETSAKMSVAGWAARVFCSFSEADFRRETALFIYATGYADIKKAVTNYSGEVRLTYVRTDPRILVLARYFRTGARHFEP
jgi:hypothetical protein